MFYENAVRLFMMFTIFGTVKEISIFSISQCWQSWN